MNKEEALESLFDEYLSYRKMHGEVSPVQAHYLLMKAYESGYKQGKADSPKLNDGGKVEFPPFDSD